METSVRTLTTFAAIGTTAAALMLMPAGVAVGAPASVTADHSSSVTLTDAQRSAVISARRTYIQSATQIAKAFRSSVGSAMDAARAQVEGQALDVALAKDAYRIAVWSGGDVAGTKAAWESAQAAYSSAWSAAKSGVQGQVDAAKAKATSDLDAAKSAYSAAIAAAFVGQTVPSALQRPPGSWSKGGWDMGGKGFGMSGMDGSSDRGRWRG